MLCVGSGGTVMDASKWSRSCFIADLNASTPARFPSQKLNAASEGAEADRGPLRAGARRGRVHHRGHLRVPGAPGLGLEARGVRRELALALRGRALPRLHREEPVRA